MGIYIFSSKHGPFIKVGHYKGQNAWSRIAHRGFYSCVCPMEIRNRVSVEDLELVAWFPNLTKKNESMIKKKFNDDRIYGKSEWFPQFRLQDIRSFIEIMDADKKEICDQESAMKYKKRL